MIKAAKIAQAEEFIMAKEDKLKALDAAIAQIERQYGKGSVMKLGDNSANMNVETVPTGSLSLDIALGLGGLPKGRIIEIYGPESSGKTTVAFQMVASTGTKNLELQYYWLKEMGNASFVFIDEFDAFYHHELSYKISKRLFKSDSQLFVTTHDTFLLSNDLLRPDCFFILNDNQIRAICDLTDKELRFGHNLEKLYRGGTFNL